MAPLQDDDFVLTISDSDSLPRSEGEFSTSETSSRTQKRKRDDLGVETQKHKRAKYLLRDAETASESNSDHSEPDVAFDPDFTFELGQNAALNDIEEFDGWGQGSEELAGNRQDKGLDLDEIIAKRVKQRSPKSKAQQRPGDGKISSLEQGGLDSEQDQADSNDLEAREIEMADWENDELLADDAFGARAQSESERDSEDKDDSAGSASDADSAASSLAHPYDLQSSPSSDENEEGDDDGDDDTNSQTSAEDEFEAEKRAAFFAPDEPSKTTNSSTAITSFQQFSISRPILRALAALSFTTPTPIQARTVPIALQGLDIVGSAQTGSGKTAAFLLPILERLLFRPRKIPTTRVTILMPTRELAVQCYNVAVALAKHTDITFAQVVGGFSLREQETVLKKRPDVVIATPGRFIDHMRNSASFTVENIEILVLDEADRMLEDGFADELDEILKTIPRGRQTMLFSATMTDSVDKLVRVRMNRPVRVSVDAKKSTVEGLVQEFIRLRPGREGLRLATLGVLCTKIFTERTIIFFRQKKEAHRVRIILGLLGLKTGELHGSMTQEQRIQAVNAFRVGKTTHLLATDLASRGLDIKNVLSVINYEAPQSHEIYLHRVGRTARAGRSGRSCTIAAEPDRKVVKAAVKAARQQGAKIVSRAVDHMTVNDMQAQIEAMESEVDDILREEKAEKALAQAETQLTRGENLVKHQDEIMARPKRTWFENEKAKHAAKERGKQQLNGISSDVLFPAAAGGSDKKNKKLSNKEKKKLDAKRERAEGKGGIKKKKKQQRQTRPAAQEVVGECGTTGGNSNQARMKTKGGAPGHGHGRKGNRRT